MAYKDVMMLEDPDIYKCFTVCRELRALPMVHAENGHLIAIVSLAVQIRIRKAICLNHKLVADLHCNRKKFNCHALYSH